MYSPSKGKFARSASTSFSKCSRHPSAPKHISVVSPLNSMSCDEPVDGKPCKVIEFTPGTKDLGYGKVVIWVRVEDLVIVKYSMHDTAGRQEKVLTLGDVRNVGPIPSPFTMEIKNIDSGSHTIVDFTEITYDTKLADDMFTQRALEHGL